MHKTAVSERLAKGFVHLVGGLVNWWNNTKSERTESTGHGSQTPNGVHRRLRVSLLGDGVMPCPPSWSWIARIG